MWKCYYDLKKIVSLVFRYLCIPYVFWYFAQKSFYGLFSHISSSTVTTILRTRQNVGLQNCFNKGLLYIYTRNIFNWVSFVKHCSSIPLVLAATAFLPSPSYIFRSGQWPVEFTPFTLISLAALACKTFGAMLCTEPKALLAVGEGRSNV